MITPEDIVSLVTKESNDNSKTQFTNAVQIAEKEAMDNFHELMNTASSTPKRIKVKLDLDWSESLIKWLVSEYKQYWKNVTYNRHDEGLREPQGNWTITIKVQ